MPVCPCAPERDLFHGAVTRLPSGLWAADGQHPVATHDRRALRPSRKPVHLSSAQSSLVSDATDAAIRMTPARANLGSGTNPIRATSAFECVSEDAQLLQRWNEGDRVERHRSSVKD